MEKRTFLKIDSILIYEVIGGNMIPIEDDNYIADELQKGYFQVEVVFPLDDLEEPMYYYANKEFLDLIKNNNIDNLSIIDYAYYIMMLEEDGEEVNKDEYYEDYKLFIDSLKQFRNEAIIKNSFKIKQKRISRTKLEELTDKIKLWEEEERKGKWKR